MARWELLPFNQCRHVDAALIYIDGGWILRHYVWR